MTASLNGRLMRGPAAYRRVKTPTVLQMEAVECGAAALAIILGYYGRVVPLETLRMACGVSRDGTKASNIVKVAREYGLKAKGFKKEPEDLRSFRLPVIVFWNFGHFLVVEGFGKGKVYLNDPGMGPREVTNQEFDEAFTGVVLAFEPGPDFLKGGKKRSILAALARRLTGSGRPLVYIMLVSLALVVPGIVIPVFTKIFVDNYLVHGMSDWVRPLLLGMALTAILRAVLTWIQQHYLLRLETKLSLSTSSHFLWHILRLPVEFFTQRYGGEIGSRVAINDRVSQLLSGRLATTFLNLSTAVFFVTLMMFYDIALTTVGLGVALTNIGVLRYVARKRKDRNAQFLQERGKLMGVSIAGLQTIETLKATGSESDFFSRWSGQFAKVVNARQELGVYSQFLSVVPLTLAAFNTVIILSLGALRVMEGRMSMGTLVAFQSLMASLTLPVQGLVQMGSTLQEAEGDMGRLDDILSSAVDRQFREPEERQIAEDVAKLPGHMELRNISFGYSRIDAPLIQGFNVKLRPGARVAVVGATGSGKSTVAKLASGLYEPWEGEVLFEGVDRRKIPRQLLASSVALVDQEISLFEGTITENLSLWDSTLSERDITGACKDACIHDDVVSRSGAYASRVEEGGRNFSGGQRQRLEIARALAGNPTMLILDEATSALDPVTEKQIDDNLRRRGCTCLIVAHRLSTIRDCDEIIVLDRGQVVQRGAHEELITVDGPYRDLMAAEN